MATKAKKPKKTKVDGRKAAGVARRGPLSKAYKRTPESGGKLTPRQQEILRLVTLGCSTREIALLLQLSTSTVDNHKAAMMRELGCTKSVLLVRKAIAMNLTKPEDILTKAEIAALGGDFIDGWNRVS